MPWQSDRMANWYLFLFYLVISSHSPIFFLIHKYFILFRKFFFLVRKFLIWFWVYSNLRVNKIKQYATKMLLIFGHFVFFCLVHYKFAPFKNDVFSFHWEWNKSMISFELKIISLKLSMKYYCLLRFDLGHLFKL